MLWHCSVGLCSSWRPIKAATRYLAGKVVVLERCPTTTAMPCRWRHPRAVFAVMSFESTRFLLLERVEYGHRMWCAICLLYSRHVCVYCLRPCSLWCVLARYSSSNETPSSLFFSSNICRCKQRASFAAISCFVWRVAPKFRPAQARHTRSRGNNQES